MQTNVGNMIGDASSTMKTKIKVWLNDGYQDAWRRCMWYELVDEDKTFTSVADLADYPINDDGKSGDMGISDFGEELLIADITNGHLLDRWQIKDWWTSRASDYNAGSLDSGNPVRYLYLPEASKIRIDPPAKTASETYAIPYKKTVSDMSDDSDTPSITSISTYLEMYAESMGFAYKGQLQKAGYFKQLAEAELRKLMREEKIKINQMMQRKLTNWGVRVRRRMVERAYD